MSPIEKAWDAKRIRDEWDRERASTADAVVGIVCFVLTVVYVVWLR